MTRNAAPSLDAIVLDVFWNRLISICNEQATALMRTSFTTIVRESEDLSAGVFDPAGNMIAQSVTGTPGHINSMATSMRHFLAHYPLAALEPGDVLITNDPWFTAGQLHDLTIMTPVFRNGRVVAFFGNTCHAADIGGRGLSADAREVYEEGLYLPILKLYRAGEPNDDVLRIIRGNVRSPEMVLGDIHAQVSCNEVGGRRLLEFMDEFELDSIEPLAQEILTRSERAMRDAIRRIPDGTYVGETWSDGFTGDEPIHIVCTVTVKGSDILVDYAGSSSARGLGINVVLNYTTAYTTFGIKAAISPDVPNNEGSFRPVTVTAPVGSILERLASICACRSTRRRAPDARGALRRARARRSELDHRRRRGVSGRHADAGTRSARAAIHVLSNVGWRDWRASDKGWTRQHQLSQRRRGRPGRNYRSRVTADSSRARHAAAIRAARDDSAAASARPCATPSDRMLPGRSPRCSIGSGSPLAATWGDTMGRAANSCCRTVRVQTRRFSERCRRRRA